MASAPILSACLVYSSTVAISGPWTPMVMAVLPPLPAATMASAPSRRSCFERVVHSLAICGQMTPCTPPRFRNLISAARRSRSSWLESVNGDDPIGKSPRIGFEPGLAAAESRLKASAEASAPPPNTLKKSRLPLASGAVVICLGITLLTSTSDLNRMRQQERACERDQYTSVNRQSRRPKPDLLCALAARRHRRGRAANRRAPGREHPPGEGIPAADKDGDAVTRARAFHTQQDGPGRVLPPPRGRLIRRGAGAIAIRPRARAATPGR